MLTSCKNIAITLCTRVGCSSLHWYDCQIDLCVAGLFHIEISIAFCCRSRNRMNSSKCTCYTCSLEIVLNIAQVTRCNITITWIYYKPNKKDSSRIFEHIRLVVKHPWTDTVKLPQILFIPRIVLHGVKRRYIVYLFTSVCVPFNTIIDNCHGIWTRNLTSLSFWSNSTFRAEIK